jgi:hypothetical protein
VTGPRQLLLPGAGLLSWEFPGPTDLFLHAGIRLAPGTVATLTAGRKPTPTAPRSGEDHTAIPAAIAAGFPPGAQWVEDSKLADDLAPGESAGQLCLDPASDTVHLFAVNAELPGTVKVLPDGTTVLPTLPAAAPGG